MIRLGNLVGLSKREREFIGDMLGYHRLPQVLTSQALNAAIDVAETYLSGDFPESRLLRLLLAEMRVPEEP